MTDTLSITIVAYNNYDDVKKVVTTLKKYTSSKIIKKIYIVDNGTNISDQNDKSTFLDYLSDMNDVFYLDPKSNLGFGKGHNVVLDKIESKYHAIVNPDIIFVEDAFSKIIEYMDSNPDVGMCIPDIRTESGDRQRAYREDPTVIDMFIRMFCKRMFPKRVDAHTLQDEDYSKPFRVPFGQGSFLVIRTDLFKELNGFDDHYFMYLEDADLCRRVNEKSCVMYFPDTKVIHKWEKGSHRNIKLLKYHIQSMFYYFNKWGWKVI